MHLLDVYANLQFERIAPLLGLPRPDRATVTAKCPSCHAAAWAVHSDTRTMEEWYYCSQCKESGTILAMAAQLLNKSDADTINFLAASLSLDITPELVSTLVQRSDWRKRLQNTWSLAQKNLMRSTPSQQALLHRLGWQTAATIGRERLLAGPAQLYGVLSNVQANENLRPLFKKITPVLAVVPFFCTPTAVTGISCFTPAEEIAVTPAKEEYHHERLEDSGFAGLRLLESAQDKTVIVTSMINPMVMLHMHHFNSSQIPLALLGARLNFRGQRENRWNLLSGRRIVFWEKKPTAALIYQALTLNADVAFLGPEVARQSAYDGTGALWWRWCHHEPARDTVLKLQRNARPIKDALRTWRRIATANEKVLLLQEAERCSADIYNTVCECLGEKDLTKVGRRISVPTKARANSVQGLNGMTTVIERDGKWWCRNNIMRLSGIVRVTHIVVRKNKKEYVGYIKSNSSKAHFQVDIKQANWGFLRRCALDQEILLTSGVGSNIHQNTRNDSFCPFDAACRFEPPKVIRGLDSIGWDGEGFQFKQTKLINGFFHQTPDFLFEATAPGPKQSQCRLTSEIQHILSFAGPEMEATWAVCFALAAQLTAASTNLSPYGIWINENLTNSSLAVLLNYLNVEPGYYKDWSHKWPRLLDSCRKVRRLTTSNFFVLATTKIGAKPPSAVLAVRLPAQELQPRLIPSSADTLLLHYLRHFTSQTRPQATTWTAWLEYTKQEFKKVFSFVPALHIEQASNRVRVIP